VQKLIMLSYAFSSFAKDCHKIDCKIKNRSKLKDITELTLIFQSLKGLRTHFVNDSVKYLVEAKLFGLSKSLTPKTVHGDTDDDNSTDEFNDTNSLNDFNNITNPDDKGTDHGEKANINLCPQNVLAKIPTKDDTTNNIICAPSHQMNCNNFNDNDTDKKNSPNNLLSGTSHQVNDDSSPHFDLAKFDSRPALILAEKKHTRVVRSNLRTVG